MHMPTTARAHRRTTDTGARCRPPRHRRYPRRYFEASLCDADAKAGALGQPLRPERVRAR